MIIRNFIFVMFVFTCVTKSSAQEIHEMKEDFSIEITSSLTMGEVVASAITISPNKITLQAKNDYAAALSNKANSLLSETPQISISHQSDRFISNQGLREWESSLDLPLWMPGQKSANKLKARMSKKENEAYEKLTTLEITGQVRELLWELKLAALELEEAKRDLQFAETLHNEITRRIDAGNLPRKDEILGSKEIMDQKIKLLNAEAEYIHVAKRYQSFTGLTQAPQFIEETVKAPYGSDKFVLDKENFPILALADANVELTRADYKISKKSWSSAPIFSIGVKKERGSALDRNINSVN